MKKISLGLIVISLFAGFVAFADDGEGLATPAQGTCDRVAYDAATARYSKDNGNPAYHLQDIKLVAGGTTGQTMVVDIDFNSVEDGEYFYRVEMKVVDPASDHTKCSVSKVRKIH